MDDPKKKKKKASEKVEIGGKTYSTIKPKITKGYTRQQKEASRNAYGTSRGPRKMDRGRQAIEKKVTSGGTLPARSKEGRLKPSTKSKVLTKYGANVKESADLTGVSKRDLKKTAKGLGETGKDARKTAREIKADKQSVYKKAMKAPKNYKGKGMKQYQKDKKKSN